MSFIKVTLPFLRRQTTFSSYTRWYSKAINGSFYDILGVNENSTHKEIKEAFYRLSKLYHPDVTNDPGARVKFQELAKAYETVGNALKRKDYDRGLFRPVEGLSTDVSVGPVGSVVEDAGRDTFSTFYVKQYNRMLTENWNRQADPEIVKTAFEAMQDEKSFAMTFYLTVCALSLGYVLLVKYLEEPVKLLKLDATSESNQM